MLLWYSITCRQTLPYEVHNSSDVVRKSDLHQFGAIAVHLGPGACLCLGTDKRVICCTGVGIVENPFSSCCTYIHNFTSFCRSTSVNSSIISSRALGAIESLCLRPDRLYTHLQIPRLPRPSLRHCSAAEVV